VDVPQRSRGRVAHRRALGSSGQQRRDGPARVRLPARRSDRPGNRTARHRHRGRARSGRPPAALRRRRRYGGRARRVPRGPDARAPHRPPGARRRRQRPTRRRDHRTPRRRPRAHHAGAAARTGDLRVHRGVRGRLRPAVGGAAPARGGSARAGRTGRRAGPWRWPWSPTSPRPSYATSPHPPSRPGSTARSPTPRCARRCCRSRASPAAQGSGPEAPRSASSAPGGAFGPRWPPAHCCWRRRSCCSLARSAITASSRTWRQPTDSEAVTCAGEAPPAVACSRRPARAAAARTPPPRRTAPGRRSRRVRRQP
jgi:hypothetical protein